MCFHFIRLQLHQKYSPLHQNSRAIGTFGPYRTGYPNRLKFGIHKQANYSQSTGVRSNRTTAGSRHGQTGPLQKHNRVNQDHSRFNQEHTEDNRSTPGRPVRSTSGLLQDLTRITLRSRQQSRLQLFNNRGQHIGESTRLHPRGQQIISTNFFS